VNSNSHNVFYGTNRHFLTTDFVQSRGSMALTTRATISSIVALSSVFDEASRTGPHPRRNVETPNLVADRHAGRLMPAHRNRKAGVSREGSARRDGRVMLTPNALICRGVITTKR
jgi:hypothetical protein